MRGRVHAALPDLKVRIAICLPDEAAISTDEYVAALTHEPMPLNTLTDPAAANISCPDVSRVRTQC